MPFIDRSIITGRVCVWGGGVKKYQGGWIASHVLPLQKGRGLLSHAKGEGAQKVLMYKKFYPFLRGGSAKSFTQAIFKVCMPPPPPSPCDY